jgi:hypothetical protein
VASRIRWIARIWMMVASVAFLAFGLRGGVPLNPDLGNWQEPVQFALLALVAVGGIIAWRWEAFGAMVIVAGAVFLGVLATAESGKFGLVSIADDDGSTVTVTLSGRDYRGEEVLHYQYTTPVRAIE